MTAVQKVVGGSLSTVSKHLMRWREVRRGAEPNASTPAPPEALSEAFRSALNVRSLELRVEFEERLREKQDEVDALMEALAALEKRMADLELDAGEASEKALLLMGENGELRARLASEETQITDMLKWNAESCSKFPTMADICRSVSDCLSLLKPELETIVRETVEASFEALANRRTVPTKSSPPKSKKAAVRAASGGSSGKSGVS
jgi:chromosome segregation ATPase